MDRFLNLDLLRNPLNWVIVWSMVGFGVLLYAMLDPLKVSSTATIAPQA